jgi:hypothetical protein
MLNYIILQCGHHYLSMFLTISQPPDLTTEPASWHFNIKFLYILIILRIIKDKEISNNLKKDNITFKIKDKLLSYLNYIYI